MKVICQICGTVYNDAIEKPVCCNRRPKQITEDQATQAVINKGVSEWHK